MHLRYFFVFIRIALIRIDDFWAEINAVIEDLGIHNRLRRMQHPVGACCLRNETTEARMVSGTLVVAGPVTWRQALVQ